jgi:acetoin utilization deacetylase AcuC-like enzyme
MGVPDHPAGEPMKPVVFYTPAMVAQVDSFSPSARKPREVVASWQQLAPALEVRAPIPVRIDEFCLAHERNYVEGVLSLRHPNGFGTRDAAVAASLPYTSGAMLSAARHALVDGVAAAACSGFHHAGYYDAHGFCTFNGLMVTACVLKTEGLVRRVGILDADHHYGDGTDSIIDVLNVDWVSHYTVGESWHRPSQAEAFLATLPGLMKRFADCDLLLYQAGADPHIDDPLGGWLTDVQLAERDRIVFTACREKQLPVAWNLAGGYQSPLRKVLDIHDATLRECIAAYSST